MNYIFVLLVLSLIMCMADSNPDNGGTQSGDKGAGEGTISSLDDAMADETEAGEPARSDTTTTGGEGGDKLLGGTFKSPEELVTAYQELERKMGEVSIENSNLKKPAAPEPEPDKDEWVELSEEQIASLQETDPEAHKWYLAEREIRKVDAAIDKKLEPLKAKIQPVDALQKEQLANQFYAQESSIFSQTKQMFGNEYESLDKQRQDVEFLQKFFKEIPQPLAHAIIEHNKNGSQEYARQLLLGQIQIHNMRQKDQKRSMSVAPDVGSSGRPRSTDSASTLEEAGDLAFQELGLK